MMQTTRLQNLRGPLIASLAALVLAALLAIAAVRSPLAAMGSDAVTTAQGPAVDSSPVTARPAETGRCGDGAYVTGDMVGDASPAAIYEAMCGSR